MPNLSPEAQQELAQILAIENQIERQIALVTASIKAWRTADLAFVDAIYCALNGGLAAPDYTPIWPDPKA